MFQRSAQYEVLEAVLPVCSDYLCISDLLEPFGDPENLISIPKHGRFEGSLTGTCASLDGVVLDECGMVQ